MGAQGAPQAVMTGSPYKAPALCSHGREHFPGTRSLYLHWSLMGHRHSHPYLKMGKLRHNKVKFPGGITET